MSSALIKDGAANAKAQRVHVRRPKRKFTQEEDELIRDEVRKGGEKGWGRISGLLKGRNGRQVRERWVNYLCPRVSNSPFTSEEDEKLEKFFQDYSGKWSTIAKLFPDRTDVALKNRYALLIRHKSKEARHKPICHVSEPEAVANVIAISKAMIDDGKDSQLQLDLQYNEEIGDYMPFLIQGDEASEQPLQF